MQRANCEASASGLPQSCRSAFRPQEPVPTLIVGTGRPLDHPHEGTAVVGSPPMGAAGWRQRVPPGHDGRRGAAGARAARPDDPRRDRRDDRLGQDRPRARPPRGGALGRRARACPRSEGRPRQPPPDVSRFGARELPALGGRSPLRATPGSRSSSTRRGSPPSGKRGLQPPASARNGSRRSGTPPSSPSTRRARARASPSI